MVTGAAGGIGGAVAAQLASRGAEVIGVDLDRPGSGTLDGIEFVTGDLTSAADRRRIIEDVGAIDLLVNAAGISVTKDLATTTESDWDSVLGINAKVPFLLMQAYADRLSDGGAIVNIASVAGKMATNVHGAPYNASKAAVLALTRTFAYALAPRGIRVNAVCPGVTRTPMLDGIFDDLSSMTGEPVDTLRAEYLRRVPLGRLGAPEEIARTVVHLLSEDAGYITGQSVNICGGLVMS
ncbi:SDR family oxidoreductase [Saccharopolyspora sp. WRP15-2]|uniref:SDR family oxidoreductase n=1 Tax=Saccharopolyspora oryzae TaxID=2997343 RepID=A0ABT4UWT0_9PSEU|nr:SDR family oxidoreductase [Saccharopolyspora oryzae]MDA3626160.1 SDR family oxidoreductase [Saccharopolyspora oryzae]